MSTAPESNPPDVHNPNQPSKVVVTLVEQSKPPEDTASTTAAQIEAFLAPFREVLNSPGIQALLQGIAKRMSDESVVAQTNANAVAEVNKLQAENTHRLAMEQQKNTAEYEKLRLEAAKQLLMILVFIGTTLLAAFVYALEKRLIETSSLAAIGVVVSTAWSVAFGRAATKTGAPANNP